MRVLLILLAAANVALFVWGSGWLAPHLPAPWQGQREPHRVQQQFEPQRIAVRPLGPAARTGEAASSGVPPAPGPASASSPGPASAPGRR